MSWGASARRLCGMAAWVAPMVAVLALAPKARAVQDPPVPPPAPRPAPARPPGAGGPAAPVVPVLPQEARQTVEQSARELIEKLQAMGDGLLSSQRPDEAAAIYAQIKLLRQATGLSDEGAIAAPPRVFMNTYRERVGQSFVFTVTGNAEEPVFGSGIYTDDTALEGAAVHAGVLRSGQTGPVQVTVLPGQKSYAASRQHGVESLASGPSGGSYRIGAGNGPAALRPTSIAAFRGRVGDTVTVPVLGATTGSVWGSDIYTDDSSLPAAVVHAGLVAPGEFAFVRVTMAEGLPAYTGTARNGVTSQNYGEFQGSFKLSRAPRPWVLILPDDIEDGSGMVSLPALRSEVGLTFSVKVMGAVGTVRGSDVYADDSSIAAAAVHAGVLRLGESGYVRLTLLPGQDRYEGSEQYGVKSASGGKGAGSFTISKGQ